jgi:hypothetical protein
MAERETPSPAEQVARLYEQTETEAAKASERLVGSGGFAAVLGMMAENAAALTKLGNDAMDLALRNLRVAGRRDVVRLSRQLARTEDKLERVLQELEEVRDELAHRDGLLSPSTRRTGRSRSNGSPAEDQAAKDEKAGQ